MRTREQAYHLFPVGIFVLEGGDGFLTEIVPDDAIDRSLRPVSSSIGETLLRDSVNLWLQMNLNTRIIFLSVGVVGLEKACIVLT